MKTALIYSGKGGVGKTTTTVHLATALLEQGKRVLIIDGDINTPSMSVIYQNNHPQENLWVHSTGHIFDNLIYFEKSMVRRFITDALKVMARVNPDVILIDTPPSITDVHINIMDMLQISTVLFVTQPNSLSNSDVIRTARFFQDKCPEAPAYIVENMTFGETLDYSLPVKARIPFKEGMRGDLVYTENKDHYKCLAEVILLSGDTTQEVKRGLLIDESYIVTRIDHHLGGFRRRRAGYALTCRYDDGTEKLRIVPKLTFQNVRSWGILREYILEDEGFPLHDRGLEELTTERIERLIKAFENDSEAYFMVTKSPCTQIKLWPGEIGRAVLMVDEKWWGVPRIKYQTSEGEVHLFAYEVIPVTMEEIAAYLQEGYKLQPDGRYIPTKEHLEMLYNAFGVRIGLSDNWEEHYDKQLKD